MVATQRFKPAVRLVAALLVLASLSYDIVWANPDGFTRNGDTLAPTSFFKDKESFDKVAAKELEERIEHNGVPRDKLLLETVKHVLTAPGNQPWLAQANITYRFLEGEILINFPGYILRYFESENPYDDGRYTNERELSPHEKASETVHLNKKLHKQLLKVAALEAKPSDPLEAIAQTRGRDDVERSMIAESLKVIGSIDKPMRTAFVVPMYREQVRLRPKTEDNPDGEDAFRKKVEEVVIMRHFNPAFQCRLVFVDDGTEGAASARLVGELWDALRAEYRARGEALDKDLVTTIVISEDEKRRLGSKKGAAVLRGMAAALADTGFVADYIGYTDVDISTNLLLAGLLVDQLRQGKAGVAFGSRSCRGAQAHNVSRLGRLASVAYATIVHIILPPLADIHDTQRAFKLFTRDAATDVLRNAREHSMAFDTELLLLARLAGHPLKEVPISWFDSPKESTVRLGSDARVMVTSLMKQALHIVRYLRLRITIIRLSLTTIASPASLLRKLVHDASYCPKRSLRAAERCLGSLYDDARLLARAILIDCGVTAEGIAAAYASTLGRRPRVYTSARIEAIQYLARTRDPRFVPVVLNQLTDSSAAVRRAAIDAAVAMDGSRDALRRALQEGAQSYNGEVRRFALAEAKRLGIDGVSAPPAPRGPMLASTMGGGTGATPVGTDDHYWGCAVTPQEKALAESISRTVQERLRTLPEKIEAKTIGVCAVTDNFMVKTITDYFTAQRRKSSIGQRILAGIHAGRYAEPVIFTFVQRHASGSITMRAVVGDMGSIERKFEAESASLFGGSGTDVSGIIAEATITLRENGIYLNRLIETNDVARARRDLGLLEACIAALAETGYAGRAVVMEALTLDDAELLDRYCDADILWEDANMGIGFSRGGWCYALRQLDILRETRSGVPLENLNDYDLEAYRHRGWSAGVAADAFERAMKRDIPQDAERSAMRALRYFINAIDRYGVLCHEIDTMASLVATIGRLSVSEKIRSNEAQYLAYFEKALRRKFENLDAVVAYLKEAVRKRLQAPHGTAGQEPPEGSIYREIGIWRHETTTAVVGKKTRTSTLYHYEKYRVRPGWDRRPLEAKVHELKNFIRMLEEICQVKLPVTRDPSDIVGAVAERHYRDEFYERGTEKFSVCGTVPTRDDFRAVFAGSSGPSVSQGSGHASVTPHGSGGRDTPSPATIRDVAEAIDLVIMAARRVVAWFDPKAAIARRILRSISQEGFEESTKRYQGGVQFVMKRDDAGRITGVTTTPWNTSLGALQRAALRGSLTVTNEGLIQIAFHAPTSPTLFLHKHYRNTPLAEADRAEHDAFMRNELIEDAQAILASMRRLPYLGPSFDCSVVLTGFPAVQESHKRTTLASVATLPPANLLEVSRYRNVMTRDEMTEGDLGFLVAGMVHEKIQDGDERALIVAIDGAAVVGKSTLATILGAGIDGIGPDEIETFRVDHFRDDIGRFKRLFNHAVGAKKVVIVEGLDAFRLLPPELRDLSIYMEADTGTRIRNAARRLPSSPKAASAPQIFVKLAILAEAIILTGEGFVRFVTRPFSRQRILAEADVIIDASRPRQGGYTMIEVLGGITLTAALFIGAYKVSPAFAFVLGGLAAGVLIALIVKTVLDLLDRHAAAPAKPAIQQPSGDVSLEVPEGIMERVERFSDGSFIAVYTDRATGRLMREIITTYMPVEGRQWPLLHSRAVYGPDHHLERVVYYDLNGIAREEERADDYAVFEGENSRWMHLNRSSAIPVLEEAVRAAKGRPLIAGEIDAITAFVDGVFSGDILGELHRNKRLGSYPALCYPTVRYIIARLHERGLEARFVRNNVHEVVETTIAGIPFVIDGAASQFERKSTLEQHCRDGRWPYRPTGLVIMPREVAEKLPAREGVYRKRKEWPSFRQWLQRRFHTGAEERAEEEALTLREFIDSLIASDHDRAIYRQIKKNYGWLFPIAERRGIAGKAVYVHEFAEMRSFTDQHGLVLAEANQTNPRWRVWYPYAHAAALQEECAYLKEEARRRGYEVTLESLLLASPLQFNEGETRPYIDMGRENFKDYILAFAGGYAGRALPSADEMEAAIDFYCATSLPDDSAVQAEYRKGARYLYRVFAHEVAPLLEELRGRIAMGDIDYMMFDFFTSNVLYGSFYNDIAAKTPENVRFYFLVGPTAEVMRLAIGRCRDAILSRPHVQYEDAGATRSLEEPVQEPSREPLPRMKTSLNNTIYLMGFGSVVYFIFYILWALHPAFLALALIVPIASLFADLHIQYGALFKKKSVFTDTPADRMAGAVLIEELLRLLEERNPELRNPAEPDPAKKDPFVKKVKINFNLASRIAQFKPNGRVLEISGDFFTSLSAEDLFNRFRLLYIHERSHAIRTRERSFSPVEEIWQWLRDEIACRWFEYRALSRYADVAFLRWVSPIMASVLTGAYIYRVTLMIGMAGVIGVAVLGYRIGRYCFYRLRPRRMTAPSVSFDDAMKRNFDDIVKGRFNDIIMNNKRGKAVLAEYLLDDTDDPRLWQCYRKIVHDLRDDPDFFRGKSEQWLNEYVFDVARDAHLIGLPAREDRLREFPGFQPLMEEFGDLYAARLLERLRDGPGEKNPLPRGDGEPMYEIEMNAQAFHAYSVAQLARLLGTMLGLDDRERDRLIIAALLHDVGKAEYIEIISSTGRLTPADWAKVNLHAERSYELIEQLLAKIREGRDLTEDELSLYLPRSLIDLLDGRTLTEIRQHHVRDVAAHDDLALHILVACDILHAILDMTRLYHGGSPKPLEHIYEILADKGIKPEVIAAIRDLAGRTIAADTDAQKFFGVLTAGEPFLKVYHAIMLTAHLDGEEDHVNGAVEDDFDRLKVRCHNTILESNLNLEAKIMLINHITAFTRAVSRDGPGSLREAMTRTGDLGMEEMLTAPAFLIYDAAQRFDLSSANKKRILAGIPVILKGEQADLLNIHYDLQRLLGPEAYGEHEGNIYYLVIDDGTIRIMKLREALESEPQAPPVEGVSQQAHAPALPGLAVPQVSGPVAVTRTIRIYGPQGLTGAAASGLVGIAAHLHRLFGVEISIRSKRGITIPCSESASLELLEALGVRRNDTMALMMVGPDQRFLEDSIPLIELLLANPTPFMEKRCRETIEHMASGRIPLRFENIETRRSGVRESVPSGNPDWEAYLLTEFAVGWANRETAATYDRMAATYAGLRGAEPTGRDLEILNIFLPSVCARVPTGRRTEILEVGGSLRDMVWWGRQPGISVTDIDLSQGMIDYIKQGMPEARVAHMDMAALTFPDAAFDGVRFQASLHHLPLVDEAHGADAAVAEAYRVLRPGGICHIFVKAEEGDRRGFMAIDTKEGLGRRYFQFYTPEVLRALLERHGFRIVRGLLPEDIEAWRDARGELNLIVIAEKPAMQPSSGSIDGSNAARHVLDEYSDGSSVAVTVNETTGEVQNEVVTDYLPGPDGRPFLYAQRTYDPGHVLREAVYYDATGTVVRQGIAEEFFFFNRFATGDICLTDRNRYNTLPFLRTCVTRAKGEVPTPSEEEALRRFDEALWTGGVDEAMQQAKYAFPGQYPRICEDISGTIYGALRDHGIPARIVDYSNHWVVEVTLAGVDFILDGAASQFEVHRDVLMIADPSAFSDRIADPASYRQTGLVIVPRFLADRISKADGIYRMRDRSRMPAWRALYDPASGLNIDIVKPEDEGNLYGGTYMIVQEGARVYVVTPSGDFLANSSGVPQLEALAALGAFYRLSGDRDRLAAVIQRVAGDIEGWRDLPSGPGSTAAAVPQGRPEVTVLNRPNSEMPGTFEFVARDSGGNVVGKVWYAPGESDTVTIITFAVQYMGIGLGRCLMRAMFNQLSAAGKTAGIGFCAKNNPEALAFYRAMAAESGLDISVEDSPLSERDYRITYRLPPVAQKDTSAGAQAFLRASGKADLVRVADLHALVADGLAAQPLKDGMKFLVSSTALDPADAAALNTVSPCVTVMDPGQMERFVRQNGGRYTKETLGCILSRSDFESWGGKGCTIQNATLVVLDDTLQGERYLYTEGVIGFTAALMQHDETRIAAYCDKLFAGADPAEIIDYLRRADPIEFAVNIILRFRPIAPIDVERLPEYKRAVDALLRAA